MKRISIIFLSFVLSVLVSDLESDAKSRRVTATGKCLQEEHMTGNQATEFARRRAKEDALRLAGIEERVWSLFGMMSSSDKHDPTFFDAWSEVSFVAIEGLVTVVEESVTSSWNEAVGLVEKVVTITADVDDDQNNVDPSYVINVDDMSEVYAESEEFECSFRIHGTDSFVKVFAFNEQNAALLYPRDFQLSDVFEKDVTHKFKSRLRKNPEDKFAYVHYLFVATKKDYRFNAKPTAKSIMSWIYKIPADERTVEMRTFMIR